MRRKFTCYRCGKYVEAEMDTDGDATCPACENVIGLEPERKLQNRIASLELQLSEARARLAWIPVDERLPEEFTLVLTFSKDNDKPVTAILAAGFWWSNVDWTLNVTHWMPLPEPPEDNYVGDSDHEHDDRIL